MDDLLAAADASGTPRSRSWIRALIRDGLLDAPDNHGIPGRRGGRQQGTWPAAQFQLLLALLNLIREGVARKALYDVPVGLWLDRGPSYVPVRQVRRALGASRPAPSRRAARHTARILAELFAGGDDLSRRDSAQLVDAFVDVAITGVLDRGALLEAARRVFDPEGVGRTVGPLGAWIGPGGMVATIEAHLAAVDSLDELDEVTFAAARAIYPQVIAMYTELQPQLSHDREVGAMFATITPKHFQKQACRFVLLTIGVLELNRQRGNAIRTPANNAGAGRSKDRRGSAAADNRPRDR